jgi:hypothetical protein
MSGLYENLPWFQGDTFGASTTSIRPDYEGMEFIVQDKKYGTGMYRKLRVCRNNSGATLLGGYAVKFNKTAGKGWTDVAGYCTVSGELTGIVDEFLAPSGVAASDLFYVVVAGPCLCKTGMVGDATNNFAVGDQIGALTAATTGATTSGRVGPMTFTGATGATLAQEVLAILGTAMSAMTTGQTNTNVLVNLGFPNW